MPEMHQGTIRKSETGEDLGIVDSLSHPQAVEIRRLLTRTRVDMSDPAILIDDEENILQALRAGISIRAVFHSGEMAVSDALRRQLPECLAILGVAKRTCKKLFQNDKVSRTFAIAEAPPPNTLGSLSSIPGDIVALDQVGIAGNIGAIIRTSLAMNVGAVVLLNADSLNLHDRRLIRSSRGYIFALTMVRATAEEFTHHCQLSQRMLTVAMPRSRFQVDELASLSQRLAIVFGGEKTGCSQALVDAADRTFSIPMNAAAESLNVSTAAAITLHRRFEFNRSRANLGHCSTHRVMGVSSD